MFCSRHILFGISVLVFLLAFKPVNAQLGFDLEIKKPEPYENRQLKAERSGKKKFTKPKRFFQNTYTHYNYFFNANNKLNNVIARAKESHRDDYATLLPFYNYSLSVTAQDKSELDSVITKAKTGIVMHDLRNDWIDDLYLLWGASYYLQQQFDSAYQMFQFINYAFADKEKDGYYRYIGSRMDGNNATSIATKEKDGLLKRMISDPPSRNTAFIWQIRTMIEANAMTEAGSLIVALRKDPAFPERLHTSLDEVQAYWFYKQEMWDSAATHLQEALGNADNKAEKARWEYLIAQLYDKAGKTEQAEDFYGKAINHTIDPVMEVYARLNLIRINKAGGDKYVDQNIETLLKMAKREKYTDYRDIIYFMAAQMELERNNLAAAQEYLLKGAKYSNSNPAAKARTYLQLADLLFIQKKYAAASSYYDSAQTGDVPAAISEHINLRKNALFRVVASLDKMARQDSLQRIAAMPEKEREAYIKKLVRQLRRQQGLKDEDVVSANPASIESKSSFSAQSKGDWYFYNAALKKSGQTTFKQVWGNRQNVDNWRRASDAVAELRTNVPDNTRGTPGPGSTDPATTITYDGLVANVPLTPEQMKVSNEVILTSMATLSNAYVNDVEDYQSAIEISEELRRRFPDYFSMNEVLMNLYFSYTKIGNTEKANEIKNLLSKNYPESRQAVIINTGKDPDKAAPTVEATKVYEDIYNQFVEGRFEEAIAAKRVADSTYKTNYWSPQLLYIEALYYVKQQQDSTAKEKLGIIAQQHLGTPLADKARNFIQVLSRRAQIEEELRNLNIERPKEDTVAVIEEPVLPTQIKRDTTQVQQNEAVMKTPTIAPTLKRDSLAITTPPPKAATGFVYDANAPYFVMVVLNKVDNIFSNEAKNAFNRYNRERYYSSPLEIQTVPLDGENKLMLIGSFGNVLQATEYMQKAAGVASKEIVPWLKSEKYSFYFITAHNLEVLKSNPDLGNYKKFLEQNTGLKF